MRYLKIIIVTALLTTAVACSKQLDSLLDNPNAPSLGTADVDLLLNTVQLSFAGFFDGASNDGGQLTRQQAWFGPIYQNGYSPNSFDGYWNTAYTSIIKNANALIPLAQKQNRFIASGMAKFMKAYALGVLVDAFGDVPYTEANTGLAQTSPKVDPAASVYAAALALYDDAIADFSKSSAAPGADLFYGGNKTKWITAAKTMKFKMLMQTRKVDATAAAKIQALVTAGDLILTATNDFNFQYGTNRTTPDSRHPDYGGNYNSSGSVGEYMADYFMWAIASEKIGTACASNGSGGCDISGTSKTTKTTLDPRQRYYFYRQNTSAANVNSVTLSCSIEAPPAHYKAGEPFCYVGAGYWGRDHGDNSGTPPDGSYRTTWGIYPAGGAFDDDAAVKVSLEMGGKGAGILPIWNSEFTHFKLAEAALTGVITGGATAARASLNTALTNNMAKVTGFAAKVGITPSATYAATSATIANYISIVLAQYDAAATDAAKLDIVGKEFYLATWGNGWEAYNNYRLNGTPRNLQGNKYAANPGFFIRSFFYPSVFMNRNLNAPVQRNLGTAVNKVFWDNNPDNFIK